MDWYLAGPGIAGRVGPLSEEEITSRIGRGEVREGHLIWQKGMPDWKEIERSPLSHLLNWQPPPLRNPAETPHAPTNRSMHSSSMCPLCGSTPADPRPLYGRMTCKKCSVKLNNKRQIATGIDATLAAVAWFITSVVIAVALGGDETGGGMTVALMVGVTTAFLLFSFRDAIGGVSPGKALFGLRVIDSKTGKPATAGQSFKRNAALYWPYLLVPFIDVISLLGLILFIVGSVQIGRGPRLGDKWANTMVVPKGKEAQLLA